MPHERKVCVNGWCSRLWWLFLLVPVTLYGQILPAGTKFEARLSTATGSRTSHRGDEVEATIISPICWQGRIVVPAGARIHGEIWKVTQLGLGLRNRTARLAYHFDQLDLADGERFRMEAQLIRVETAREHVDEHGVVFGVRPLANLSSASAFYTVPLLFLNPAVGIPVLGLKTLIAPAANAEILFPAGTEITLSLSRPFDTSDFPHPPSGIGTLTTSEIAKFQKSLQSLPQLRARAGNRASDAVNLLLIGSRRQIDDAFRAASWSTAEGKSPLTLYRMYNALTRRIGYLRAPMNWLTLNGKRSAFTYQKSLDTIARRHHVRFWKYPSAANVWLGAATEDIALRFRPIHWTHLADPSIDKERTKVVNDLAFTGCVDSVGLLPLNSPPEFVLNDRIKTDHNIAIVRLNRCNKPTAMVGAQTQVAWRHQRVFARLATSFRDDVTTCNPLFTAFNTLRFLASRPALPPTPPAVRTGTGLPSLDWINQQKLTRASAEPTLPVPEHSERNH